MSAAVVDAMSPLPLPLPRSFGILPSSSSSSSSPSSSHLRFLAMNRLATDLSAPFLRLRISNGGRAIRSVVCSSVYSSKSPFSIDLVPRLRISNGGRAIRSVVCTSVPNSSENYDADSSKSPSQEAVFDIKLPRRSLMVQFTCDSCGERTKRLINRVAYEKGTVFLQCAGCLVYHKFVDNLGLVVEYDLREEHGVDSDGTD